MKHFDQNEWFVLVNLLAVIVIMCVLPKRFPHSTTLLLLLFCITTAESVDFLLGGTGIDFYDVNDGPGYCLFDVFVYFMYAPSGYLFVYLMDWMQIRGRMLILYILATSLLAYGYERINVIFHVFTYLDGYNTFYSFPIYLFSQTGIYLLYRFITDTPKKAAAPLL